MQHWEQRIKVLTLFGIHFLNITRRSEESKWRAKNKEQLAVRRPHEHVKLKVEAKLCYLQPAQVPRSPFSFVFHGLKNHRTRLPISNWLLPMSVVYFDKDAARHPAEI